MLSLALLLHSQNARPIGSLINGWDEDAPRVAALNRDGDCEVRTNAVAYFAPGKLEKKDREKIADTLEKGMKAAKAELGMPRWNYKGDKRIYFYFPDESFISHAPGGNVALIPFERIKTGQAPWLHESMHLLLWSPNSDWLSQPEEIQNKRMPLWLEEGLADSLAMRVSAKAKIANYSPLFDADLKSVTKICVASLNTKEGKAVLPFVGSRGKPAELFGPNRFEYAVPFYAYSASFTTYLAQKYGYQMLVTAQFAHDQELESIERSTGATMTTHRKNWLATLK